MRNLLTVLLPAILLLSPTPATLAEYTAKDALAKCRVATHTPDADVEYKPGVDASGKLVLPADINKPVLSAEDVGTVDIPLELPLSGYVKTDKYNADLSDTRIVPGHIKVSKDKAEFNGKTIWPQEGEYDPECVKKLLPPGE